MQARGMTAPRLPKKKGDPYEVAFFVSEERRPADRFPAFYRCAGLRRAAPPADRSTCGECAMLDMDAFALLERRRLAIVEVAQAAVLHSNAHLVARFATQVFFDRVAGEAAADRAEHRHRRSSVAAAELVAEQAAGHRAADRADARAVTFVTHRSDRFDRAARRAVSRLTGLCARLLRFTVRLLRKLSLLGVLLLLGRLLAVRLRVRGLARLPRVLHLARRRGHALTRGCGLRLHGLRLWRSRLLLPGRRRHIGGSGRIDDRLRRYLRRLRLIVLDVRARRLGEHARDRGGSGEARHDDSARRHGDQRMQAASGSGRIIHVVTSVERRGFHWNNDSVRVRSTGIVSICNVRLGANAGASTRPGARKLAILRLARVGTRVKKPPEASLRAAFTDGYKLPGLACG